MLGARLPEVWEAIAPAAVPNSVFYPRHRPRAWANADSAPYSEHHEVYHLKIRHPCPEAGCHRVYTYRRDLSRHIWRDHTKASHEKEAPWTNGSKRARRARPVPNQTRPRAQSRPQIMDAHQIPDQRESTSKPPSQLDSVLTYGAMSPPIPPAHYTGGLPAVLTDPTAEIWPAS